MKSGEIETTRMGASVKSEPEEGYKTSRNSGINNIHNRKDDGGDDDDNDDDEVEDVTEKCLAQQRAKREKAQENAEQLSSSDDEHSVISISSGSSSDNATDGESDYVDDDDDRKLSADDEDDDLPPGTWKDDDDVALLESLEDTKPKKKPRMSQKPKRNKDPPLHVIMENRDLPSAPGKPNEGEDEQGRSAEGLLEEGSALVEGRRNKKIDQAIKDRIIKLLNTGFHDQSNENEAKNAMKLAQRLMRKHNLSQALLLQERQEKNRQDERAGGDNEILKGGIVIVRMVNRNTNKAAVFARWIAHLTHPICKNFDVKSYHSVSRGRKCHVAFYGIYTNCQLAAYAFKVATERISQMMTEYRPDDGGIDDFHSFSPKVSTKSSRLSYAIGIVEGIDQDVDRNIAYEKEGREKEFEKKRKAAFRGEAYEESDDEEDKEASAGFSFARDDDDNPATKPSNDVVGTFDPHAIFSCTDTNEGVDGVDFDSGNVDTLFDHVDDSSLSYLDRVKRDPAKKVIHMSKDDGKKWIQEQKVFWKEQLPPDEFKAVWKDAKGYAFEVWNASQKKGFPKSKEELAAIRRDRLLKEIEKEKQAAIVLVDHREKIADQVLEDQGIKLSKGRKRSRMSFDRRSFNQGVEDAKDIDINQRAIRDEVKFKTEEGGRRPRHN